MHVDERAGGKRLTRRDRMYFVLFKYYHKENEYYVDGCSVVHCVTDYYTSYYAEGKVYECNVVE